VLPAKDARVPGRRPLKGASTSTVALASVIAAPLAALVVGLLAVVTAGARHREELAHDRRNRESDALRAALDQALEAARNRHQ
jgi:hypothetical protein